jgi:hypothetical protein
MTILWTVCPVGQDRPKPLPPVGDMIEWETIGVAAVLAGAVAVILLEV